MRSRNDSATAQEKWFEDIKREVLKIDPVAFAENYLTIDGNPLRLSGTGWKFMADIYRYVAVKALEPTGKPVVCVKGRQIGATTMATALELYFCASGLFGTSPKNPPIRVLHCFPALALVQKFAKDKLSTMMRTSINNYVLEQSLGYDEDTGKRNMDVPDDTLTEKQFKFENRLWVDSNANDASRLHGMSLDAIFYDEVQRMLQDDIGNSRRTLTAARYGPPGQGIQLYFGTPLQKGSNFYKMWTSSDQRLYHLGCAACGHLYPIYTPGNEKSWEAVLVFGNTVQCPACNHQQDKAEGIELGKWVPTKTKMDDGTEPPYVGFHFNQLLIPRFTREYFESERPGIHPTNSDRIWQNEILGEFYSGSDMPMSEEEINRYCRDPNRKISFAIHNSTDFSTFMGIDWGAKTDSPESKGGKSYSSIVITSVGGDGIVNIENAFKLKKNDFEHKKEVVHEMYRRFGVKIAVADVGYANDLVPELQREYGSRLLGCLNSGSLVNPYKYDIEDLRLICNPHVVLDEIFAQMRKGKFKFPWQSFDQIQWLIEHCCSMEKGERIIQGQSYPKYEKGVGPNDGLMALMYAYLAYKFYLTKGFSIKQHQINGKSKGPILAYLPNM